jgi:hypothetical protein
MKPGINVLQDELGAIETRVASACRGSGCATKSVSLPLFQRCPPNPIRQRKTRYESALTRQAAGYFQSAISRLCKRLSWNFPAEPSQSVRTDRRSRSRYLCIIPLRATQSSVPGSPSDSTIEVASRPPGYGLCAAGLRARLLLGVPTGLRWCRQARGLYRPAGKSDPIDGLEIRVFECHTGMARAARRVTPQLIGKVDTPFWRTFARDSRLS